MTVMIQTEKIFSVHIYAMLQILLAESIAVGIMLVLVSFVVMSVLHKIAPNDYSGCLNLPKPATKYYIATFLIGVLTHLLCEATKINQWYCRHGNACKSAHYF